MTKLMMLIASAEPAVGAFAMELPTGTMDMTIVRLPERASVALPPMVK